MKNSPSAEKLRRLLNEWYVRTDSVRISTLYLPAFEKHAHELGISISPGQDVSRGVLAYVLSETSAGIALHFKPMYTSLVLCDHTDDVICSMSANYMIDEQHEDLVRSTVDTILKYVPEPELSKSGDRILSKSAIGATFINHVLLHQYMRDAGSPTSIETHLDGRKHPEFRVVSYLDLLLGGVSITNMNIANEIKTCGLDTPKMLELQGRWYVVDPTGDKSSLGFVTSYMSISQDGSHMSKANVPSATLLLNKYLGKLGTIGARINLKYEAGTILPQDMSYVYKLRAAVVHALYESSVPVRG